MNEELTPFLTFTDPTNNCRYKVVYMDIAHMQDGYIRFANDMTMKLPYGVTIEEVEAMIMERIKKFGWHGVKI